jgi:hypothetical protein
MSNINRIEKYLYGYLIHYTIYFYILKHRKPKSIKEFYEFFVNNFQDKKLIEDILNTKDGKQKLMKILRVWFYKVNTNNLNKLINTLKEMFETKLKNVDNVENTKSLKELINNSCNVEIEKSFILTIPKYDRRTNKIKFKISKFRPDILIVCKEPINLLIVVELKSGNRKLWKKYRKQIKQYLISLSQLSQFKDFYLIGIIYYFKSQTITIAKFNKSTNSFQFITL